MQVARSVTIEIHHADGGQQACVSVHLCEFRTRLRLGCLRCLDMIPYGMKTNFFSLSCRGAFHVPMCRCGCMSLSSLLGKDNRGRLLPPSRRWSECVDSTVSCALTLVECVLQIPAQSRSSCRRRSELSKRQLWLRIFQCGGGSWVLQGVDDKFKVLRIVDIKLDRVCMQAFDAHSQDLSSVIA